MKDINTQARSARGFEWTNRHRIVKVNPVRVRGGKDFQGRCPITRSNTVVIVVRRWVIEYGATTTAMNDICSSLAKESTTQRISVNALSSSSTVKGKLKTLVQQAGLFVCRCALARVRCHYGVAQSSKSGEVPQEVPILIKMYWR